MRNVIFFSLAVILVSQSVCLAQQNPQQEAKPTPIPLVPTSDPKQKEIKPAEQDVKNDSKPNTQSVTQQAPNPTTQKATAQEQGSATTQNIPTQSNGSIPTPIETKTANNETESNKTENKPSTEKAEPVTQKAGDDQVVPNKETATTLKPEEKADKAPTTMKPENKTEVVPPKDDTKPTAADEPKEVLKTRAFDGASFVGGIVLTLGLLAVSFVGFKYYKNLTKENYHIL